MGACMYVKQVISPGDLPPGVLPGDLPGDFPGVPVSDYSLFPPLAWNRYQASSDYTKKIDNRIFMTKMIFLK